MRRRGRGERLTDEQLTGLRQARKRHRTENRKRKMLRMDEEGVSSLPLFHTPAVVKVLRVVGLSFLSLTCPQKMQNS